MDPTHLTTCSADGCKRIVPRYDDVGGGGFCSDRCREVVCRQQNTTTPFLVEGQPVRLDALAEQLALQCGRVREASSRDPLSMLKEAMAAIEDAEDLAAAAAVMARHRGIQWADIGAAATLSGDTARHRWKTQKIRAQLARHARRRRARRQLADDRSGSPPRRPPGDDLRRDREMLARALRQLYHGAGESLTLADLAAAANASVSHISRILSGKRLPTWEMTESVTSTCGGNPEDFRRLWAAAHGSAPPPRPLGHTPEAFDRAYAALQHAIVGLRLAAGSPSVDDICSIANWRGSTLEYEDDEFLRDLSPRAVEMLFEPKRPQQMTIPVWETVEAVVEALGGCPATVEPLWEQLKFVRDAEWSPDRPEDWDLLARRPIDTYTSLPQRQLAW